MMLSRLTDFAGGQVVFLVRTTDVQDLAFLQRLLKRHPDAYAHHMMEPHKEHDYHGMYNVVRDNQIYIKMDDDIVYIRVS